MAYEGEFEIGECYQYIDENGNTMEGKLLEANDNFVALQHRDKSFAVVGKDSIDRHVVEVTTEDVIINFFENGERTAHQSIGQADTHGRANKSKRIARIRKSVSWSEGQFDE